MTATVYRGTMGHDAPTPLSSSSSFFFCFMQTRHICMSKLCKIYRLGESVTTVSTFWLALQKTLWWRLPHHPNQSPTSCSAYNHRWFATQRSGLSGVKGIYTAAADSPKVNASLQVPNTWAKSI